MKHENHDIKKKKRKQAITHFVKILHKKSFTLSQNARDLCFCDIPQNATYWRLGIGVVPNRTPKNHKGQLEKTMKKHLHVIFSPRLSPNHPPKAPPKSFGVFSKLRGGGQCHLKLMDRSISKASKIEGLGSLKLDESMDRTGGRELHSFKLAMVPRRPASSLSIVGLWKWMDRECLAWKNGAFFWNEHYQMCQKK